MEVEKIILEIICRLGGIFSTMGGLFIIANFFIFERLRSGIPNKLLFMQGISDVGVGITYAIFGLNIPANSAFCTIQAILVNFFDLWSAMWPAAIITSILVILVSAPKAVSYSLFFLYHIVCWGVPLISTIVLIAVPNLIGKDASDGVCWIRGSESIWKIYLGYIPVWMNMAYILIIYIVIGVIFCVQRQRSTVVSSEDVSLKSGVSMQVFVTSLDVTQNVTLELFHLEYPKVSKQAC